MGTHPKVVQPCNISSTEHTPITAESYRENIQIKASSSKFPVLDYMPDVGTTTTTSDESFLNNVGISIHSTIHLDTDESKVSSFITNHYIIS